MVAFAWTFAQVDVPGVVLVHAWVHARVYALIVAQVDVGATVPEPLRL